MREPAREKEKTGPEIGGSRGLFGRFLANCEKWRENDDFISF